MIWDVIIGFEPGLLVGFIFAGLILNITLGADLIFISASGLAGGLLIGMAAALGGEPWYCGTCFGGCRWRVGAAVGPSCGL